MARMSGRKKGTAIPPCYTQLGAIIEDYDVTEIPVIQSDSNNNGKHDADSHLDKVVDTANKLHLKTQRPSVVAWKAQYLSSPSFPQINGFSKDPSQDGRLTSERKTRINEALDWIKSELLELRRQDQSLARQLLGIRRDIYRLRLSWSCEEHQDMLEDIQIGMEEFSELSRVLDVPYEGPLSSDSLKQLGVTKMNLALRRFSTC